MHLIHSWGQWSEPWVKTHVYTWDTYGDGGTKHVGMQTRRCGRCGREQQRRVRGQGRFC